MQQAVIWKPEVQRLPTWCAHLSVCEEHVAALCKLCCEGLPASQLPDVCSILPAAQKQQEHAACGVTGVNLANLTLE
jgi:hypothetical protein